MVVAGGWLQHLVYRSRWLSRRRERVERAWKRYGIPGLALQAPLLTGTLLATVLALSLGAPLRPLLYWMLASIVLWGAVLTGAAALGLSMFYDQGLLVAHEVSQISSAAITTVAR